MQERGPVQGLALISQDAKHTYAYLELTDEDQQLRFQEIPEGSHWLVSTHSEADARFAYVHREPILVRAGEETRHSMSLQTHNLVITLLEEDASRTRSEMIVAVLERPNDPSWRLSSAELGVPVVGGWRLRVHGLAAGDYRLDIIGFERATADKISFSLPAEPNLEIGGAWR